MNGSRGDGCSTASPTSPRGSATIERGQPIAVAVTVKNEERTIRRLLDGLLSQTCPPAEVIVSDGGSQDRTAAIIAEYQARGAPVRLLTAPGACRGRGRNLAVAATQTEWVALIDGGCLPDARWLEELLRVAEIAPPCDAVFGVVVPLADSLLTECICTASFPAVSLEPGRRAMSFSVASLLVRREVWKALGGFVEGRRTGEDLIFVEGLRRSLCSVGIAADAVVHWDIPRTIPAVMRRIAQYSCDSLDAGLGHTWHHRAFLYDAVGLVLVALGVAHAAWWLVLIALLAIRIIRTVIRNEKRMRGIRAFSPSRLLLIGGILLAMDAATLYGAWRWLIRLRRIRPMSMTAPL